MSLATESGPTPTPLESEVPDPEQTANLVVDTVTGLVEGFVRNLPLLVAGLLLLVVGVLLARFTSRQVERGLRRSKADPVVTSLVGRVVNAVVVAIFLLIALSVGGVDVGAAVAGLGVAGLALAFALQNILENLVSGVLLSINKPFVAGEVITSGEYEGIVEKLDLRVTHLRTTDGQLVLIPNADVYRTPLVNVTRAGKRRTDIVIGIDYRDDHLAAFEVLREAVGATDGVMDAPAPVVLLDELGDSGVNFVVRFWSAPGPAEVAEVASRVRANCKTAVEAAGMTIPWPIRTLVVDSDSAVVKTRGEAAD